MDWLIAIPAWGPRCFDLFLNKALPAVVAAQGGISGNARLIVHTDKPVLVQQLLGGAFRGSIVREVPPGKTPHESFGHAHREALQFAADGECVAFINADMVGSIELFSAAEKRFLAGKRMIMMAGSRTVGGDAPIGAKSADLLRWAMQHRHPAIQECFWGSGRSGTPWAIYFERGDDIVLHGFHLHPFAVMKDRHLKFEGKTIDVDLADNFKWDEIHLVTDPDEASFAEISPPERVFPLRSRAIGVVDIADWAKRHATPLHRRLFAQQIRIKGRSGPDVTAQRICAAILRRI
jgi:hypothetical protein